MIVDFDDIGADRVIENIECVNYPNDCISPRVATIETTEVDWSDDHPLNFKGWEVFFKLLFSIKE